MQRITITKHTTTMKLKQAIKTLKKHQQWRLGAEYVKPAKEKKLTEAIIIILKANELYQKFLKSGEIGDFEELKKL